MPNLNTKIFYLFNSLAGHYIYLDESIIFLTTYLVEIVFVFVGVYIIVWKPFLHRNSPTERVQQFRYAMQTASCLLITWIVVKALKLLIAYPRPFETLTNSNLLVTIRGGDSFPSGHAAMTMALATFIYYRHKTLGILLFAFSILVAFSRMYVGVHYPLDVFVGIVIGLLIPAIFYKIVNKKQV